MVPVEEQEISALETGWVEPREVTELRTRSDDVDVHDPAQVTVVRSATSVAQHRHLARERCEDARVRHEQRTGAAAAKRTLLGVVVEVPEPGGSDERVPRADVLGGRDRGPADGGEHIDLHAEQSEAAPPDPIRNAPHNLLDIDISASGEQAFDAPVTHEAAGKRTFAEGEGAQFAKGPDARSAKPDHAGAGREFHVDSMWEC